MEHNILKHFFYFCLIFQKIRLDSLVKLCMEYQTQLFSGEK